MGPIERHIGALMVCMVAFAAPRAGALEVAGISLPQDIELYSGDETLYLNGAGVRYKWFFKIYVAALYLTARNDDVESILNLDRPKAVAMHFLYDEISAEKLRDAWRSGIKTNTTEAEFAALEERLARFNGFFTSVVEGDVLRVEYLPASGTHVYLNRKHLGRVQGEDFNRALLRVWLGEAPIDEDLKAGMLGSDS